jgi:beta-lactam-binding protein with PASTA domain
VVSKGEEPKKPIEIPDLDLTGDSFETVQAYLETFGLIVRKTPVTSYEYAKDIVVSIPAIQSGEKLYKGDIVYVEVSKGPGPTTNSQPNPSLDQNVGDTQ